MKNHILKEVFQDHFTGIKDFFKTNLQYSKLNVNMAYIKSIIY